MSIQGWFYLHTNKELIYKIETDGSTAADIRESNFCHSMWPFDPNDRGGAWRILVEANSLGANSARIKELAEKWGCNDMDAQNYADRLGVALKMDGDKWCATPPWFDNLQENEAGFGETCLEALSELCEQIGFTGGKMWNATFESLLNPASNEPLPMTTDETKGDV